jgi:hypothetical protein
MRHRFALRHPLATASLLLGLAFAPSLVGAATTDLAGMRIENQQTVAGTALVLNGAGIRYKTVFKVYAAGLYLTSQATTPDEALATPGPKRLAITMLRDIDSAELGKLFSRGMEDNMDRAAFSKLVPGVLRMGQVFSSHKQLKAGDSFLIDWVPGTGTVITIKGKVEGEPFKEPEFFNALMRIWLGKSPADWQLKEALLGQAKK